MTNLNLKSQPMTVAALPGAVARVDCVLYYHWAIVSNRMGGDGKLMLIDIDKGRSVIALRSQSEVIGDRDCIIEGNDWPAARRAEVLDAAMANVGQRWEYDFSCNNCEHFARLITTKKRESRQVSVAAGAAAIGGIWAALNGAPLSAVAGRAVLWGGAALALDNCRRQLPK